MSRPLLCDLANLSVTHLKGFARYLVVSMLLHGTIGGTMTSTGADGARGSTAVAGTSTGRLHPLFALLLPALVLRLAAALWPNVMYPDEIFQYLEPAWRMLGHDGILTWEWREGIRGWFLPTLLAGPVAVGGLIAPGARALSWCRAWSPHLRHCRSWSAPGSLVHGFREPMPSSRRSRRQSGSS
ncbi:hypothetical protein J2R76_005020 [Bradyrhizobium sp. USDA 4532]|uniref:hypothetical protein n=1 Tax=unclassified Bradyrhizobium TaxID=2631580 RepID=UPI00209EA7C0|nr:MULTISPECIES: hypothetical protein [unclassified Bradyrhizobium]MCP1836681.1 hypothetical protein [Bradyrhizobium sp. USDA 4545]MCP1921429.1 hypothetical protein [Bradyrhizobium sp. USDA 4532]